MLNITSQQFFLYSRPVNMHKSFEGLSALVQHEFPGELYTGAYLDLLRFYLNHIPLLRSSKEHRKGKTPAELMLKEQHRHWLEMLGLAPFRKLAV
jgi:hypothetical protein